MRGLVLTGRIAGSVVLLCCMCCGVTTDAQEVKAGAYFETDVLGAPDPTVPVIQPWQRVVIDGDYGGYWVVVGDVNGDAQLEIVSARNVDENDSHYTSAVVAQRLDGTVLWRWGDPDVGRRELHHDVACQIHDLDHDGINEVVLAADQQLIVLAGPTGKVLWSFPIPLHASDCVVFADLTGRGWAGELLVKNRYQQIWAYTREGKLLWTAAMPGGYRTAHQPLPVDLDGDGRDEVLAGYAALNSDGTERWVFTAQEGARNGGHADCWRVHTLANQPHAARLAMTMCGGNALVMTDGNGKLLWKQTGHHYEAVDVGTVCRDVPGKQLVVDVDHLSKPPKPLCVFSDQGELLGRINTDYTRHHILIDWDGDGIQEIGSAVPRGLFDGHGNRVATLAVDGDDERPLMMAPVDTCGRGADAVVLATRTPEGACRVYLFHAQGPAANGPSGVPRGTGLNFTFY